MRMTHRAFQSMYARYGAGEIIEYLFRRQNEIKEFKNNEDDDEAEFGMIALVFADGRELKCAVQKSCDGGPYSLGFELPYAKPDMKKPKTLFFYFGGGCFVTKIGEAREMYFDQEGVQIPLRKP